MRDNALQYSRRADPRSNIVQHSNRTLLDFREIASRSIPERDHEYSTTEDSALRSLVFAGEGEKLIVSRVVGAPDFDDGLVLHLGITEYLFETE